jgi:hypothetical protein
LSPDRPELERAYRLGKLRALLDAVEVLLQEANRSVPDLLAQDDSTQRDALHEMHNSIQKARDSVRHAALKTIQL